MDALGTLLAVATIVLVVAYIAQPFLAARREDAERGAERVTGRGLSTLKQRADLLAERNRIYREIKALDFDHQTGKLMDEDYADQRYQLVAQGVEVLQQLDRLPSPDDDVIERAVLKTREGAPLTPADVEPPLETPADGEQPTGFCPQCGAPTYAGDRFCARCGTALSSAS
jgi:hypothetical protein